MTDQLLDELTITEDTSGSDLRHFFSKEDLDLNLLEGARITALCGFVREGLANPAGNGPICEECHRIYETKDDE